MSAGLEVRVKFIICRHGFVVITRLAINLITGLWGHGAGHSLSILIVDTKRNITEIPDRNKSHEKTTKKFDVLVEIIFVIGERFMGVFQYGHFPHYN